MLAMPAFYRYVDDSEKTFVERNHFIMSRSGFTWFTPDVYNSAAQAKAMLALDQVPVWRIGPIRAEDMPDFDHCALRTVGPTADEDGGGWECATTMRVVLFTVTRLEP